MFRPIPAIGPEFYKTYTMAAPLASHWRQATCEEYECDKFLHGFVLTVDVSTELGQQQAYYVRHDKTRRCSEQKLSDTLIKFVYGPGNDCFDPERSTHRVPIGRPPYYLVVDGDWRGNPRGTTPYHHRRADDWVEDFALHQQGIAKAVQEG